MRKVGVSAVGGIGSEAQEGSSHGHKIRTALTGWITDRIKRRGHHFADNASIRAYEASAVFDLLGIAPGFLLDGTIGQNVSLINSYMRKNLSRK